MKIAVDLWNDGKDKEEIADEMKLAISTIDRYLRVMSKSNLCNYNVKRKKFLSIKSKRRWRSWLIENLDNQEKKQFVSQ